MMKEEGSYMRDYIISREGNIEALTFTDINECRQEEMPLSKAGLKL